MIALTKKHINRKLKVWRSQKWDPSVGENSVQPFTDRKPIVPIHRGIARHMEIVNSRLNLARYDDCAYAKSMLTES